MERLGELTLGELARGTDSLLRSKRPRFTVVLEATEGDGIHALRAFLKRALRSYGLKCVEVREA